jgi:hypothetical protein
MTEEIILAGADIVKIGIGPDQCVPLARWRESDILSSLLWSSVRMLLTVRPIQRTETVDSSSPMVDNNSQAVSPRHFTEELTGTCVGVSSHDMMRVEVIS